jgi:DNA-binding LacI/PurR family transcriptional regulator
MREIFFRRVSNSDSANRKSKGQKRTRHRRWAAIITIASLFTAWTAAQAQQPKKLPRIGYLAAPDAATEAARADGFRQALRELGYIDGQTIAIEYRYTQGKPERAKHH